MSNVITAVQCAEAAHPVAPSGTPGVLVCTCGSKTTVRRFRVAGVTR